MNRGPLALFCISCERETHASPCEQCGADPLLDGRYVLNNLLGGSRYSRTWSAMLSGKRVAVQEMPLGFADPQEISQLLQHEVKLLKRLDHPGVIRTHEGLLAPVGGRWALFLAQEFISGDTLGQELSTGVFTEQEVLDVIEELGGILAALHSHNPPVFHRNLKPDNIVRRRSDGSLVLIDFGGVRDLLHDLDGRPGPGGEGFGAPEQRRGRVGPQADLYSLGVTAITLLTGRAPLDLISPDTGKLEWTRQVQVSPSVQWLLQGLVEHDPSRRVRNTQELTLRLKTVRGPKRNRRKSSSSSAPPRKRKSSPVPSALGGGLQPLPQARASLEEAETVLYQGDENAGGLSDLEGDDTFLGLPDRDGRRELPKPTPLSQKPTLGRRAVDLDPRDEADAPPSGPPSQTLVADDSEISEPPAEDPYARHLVDARDFQPSERPAPRYEAPRQGAPRPMTPPDALRSGERERVARRQQAESEPQRGRRRRGGTRPPPEPPDQYRSNTRPPRDDRYRADSRPPPADRYRAGSRPPPADRYRADSRPPPADRYRADSRPPTGDRFRADSRPPDDRYRADSQPPPQRGLAGRAAPFRAERSQPPPEPRRGSLPPPMPSVGPTPAELARAQHQPYGEPHQDIHHAPTAPPPPPRFLGRKHTLPPPGPGLPPSGPTLEPPTVGAIDPTLSAPTRPPPPAPAPQPGLTLGKGTLMALMAVIVALIVALAIALWVLFSQS